MLSKELLQRFRDGKVVLRCPTEEILKASLEAVAANGCEVKGITEESWNLYGENTVIDHISNSIVMYGGIGLYKAEYPRIEIVTLSIEGLKEYSEVAQVTIWDGRDSAGVTSKAKVTKVPNGYTVEILPEPRFSIGDTFVISSGKLGKVIDSPEYINGKYTYKIQWTDRKKNKCQPEDSMIKLEEAFK